MNNLDLYVVAMHENLHPEFSLTRALGLTTVILVFLLRLRRGDVSKTFSKEKSDPVSMSRSLPIKKVLTLDFIIIDLMIVWMSACFFIHDNCPELRELNLNMILWLGYFTRIILYSFNRSIFKNSESETVIIEKPRATSLYKAMTGQDFLTNIEKSFGKKVFRKSLVSTYFSWIVAIVFSFLFDSVKIFDEISQIGLYFLIFGTLFWRFDDRLGRQWQILTQTFYSESDSKSKNINLAIDAIHMDLHGNKGFEDFVLNQIYQAAMNVTENHSRACEKNPRFALEHPVDDKLYSDIGSQLSPLRVAGLIRCLIELNRRNFVLYSDEVVDLLVCSSDVNMVLHENQYGVAKDMYTFNGYKKAERQRRGTNICPKPT